MKYLGIDYGSKRVGLAISDSYGKVAMPYKIIENNDNLLDEILKIIDKEKIDEIVIGKSKNLNNKDNLIQKEIDEFIFKIEKKIKVNQINEIYTSSESKLGILKGLRRTDKKSRKVKKEFHIDDKAASMILKTFLDLKKEYEKK